MWPEQFYGVKRCEVEFKIFAYVATGAPVQSLPHTPQVIPPPLQENMTVCLGYTVWMMYNVFGFTDCVKHSMTGYADWMRHSVTD